MERVGGGGEWRTRSGEEREWKGGGGGRGEEVGVEGMEVELRVGGGERRR